MKHSFGRIIVKFMSNNHLQNTSEIEDAKLKNNEFYQKWSIQLEDKFIQGSKQKERTFIMIKPDGVQRGLVGQIFARFETKGFKNVAMKLC